MRAIKLKQIMEERIRKYSARIHRLDIIIDNMPADNEEFTDCLVARNNLIRINKELKSILEEANNK